MTISVIIIKVLRAHEGDDLFGIVKIFSRVFLLIKSKRAKKKVKIIVDRT